MEEDLEYQCRYASKHSVETNIYVYKPFVCSIPVVSVSLGWVPIEKAKIVSSRMRLNHG